MTITQNRRLLKEMHHIVFSSFLCSFSSFHIFLFFFLLIERKNHQRDIAFLLLLFSIMPISCFLIFVERKSLMISANYSTSTYLNWGEQRLLQYFQIKLIPQTLDNKLFEIIFSNVTLLFKISRLNSQFLF